MELKQQLMNSAKSLSILVMDSDEKNSQVLVKFLEQVFAKVDYSNNAKEALTLFKTHKHDILMCDLNLPGMEGLSLVKEVHKVAFLTPTVLISEKNDHVIYKWAVDAGVDYVIHKPFKTEEIIASLAPLSQIKRFHNLVEFQARRIKNVLDVQPHLYCVYEKDQVVFANQAFYHSLNITKLAEINTLEDGFEKRFIDDESYFLATSSDWYKEAYTRNSEKLKIRLKDERTNEIKTYRIYISLGMNEDEYVVALIDNTEREISDENLNNLAVTDVLTGLLNSVNFRLNVETSISSFKEQVLQFRHQEVERAKKSNPEKEKSPNNKISLTMPSYSLIFFDIDNLRNIKMTQGYRIRDALIKEVVDVINKKLDENMLFTRWSGEEFMVACPDFNLDESETFAENLRVSIESYSFSNGSDITCSFGVTQLLDQDTFDTFLDCAEKLLISAKRSGHNRVIGNRSADEVSAKEMKIRNEIIEKFEVLFENNEEISVHSYFHGLGLQRSSSIIEMNKTGVSVNASVNLLVAMNDTNFAYIVHDTFEKVIKARVTNMFVPQEKAVLGDFLYVDSSPLDRSVVKLECDEPVSTLIAFRKKRYEAEILEISINELTILLKENITFRKGDDLKLKFILPQSAEEVFEFVTKAKVISLIESEGEIRLYIRLFLDKWGDNAIGQYIHFRQFQLSDEVTSKVQFLKGAK